MLIFELLEKDPGLFMAVNFSKETLDSLQEFAESLDITNITPREDMHTTIVFSEKHADVKPEIYEIEINPDTYEWALFGPNENILVLKFQSEKLEQRFHTAIDAGAVSSYPEYKPHVTISYEPGEIDISKLPLPDFPLVIDEEYQTALNKNWLNK